MEYRPLGTSGLDVSRLSLGAMTFGSGMPPISNVDASAAEAMLEQAVEAGVNFVDTADVYSGGESERIVASVLTRHRDRLLVATKVGFMNGERPLSRPAITASVDGCLERLGIERVDVLYLHRPDRHTPLDETLDAVAALVDAGKVRTYGVSNWTASETAYAIGRQRALTAAEPTSVQVYWSLVGREVEHEIVPMCARLDVGVVVWSPLAAGYLAGRTDGRRSVYAFPPIDEGRGAEVLSVLRRVAAELDSTPATVAIAWLLAQSSAASVIVGASSQAQLDANLTAGSLSLTDGQLRALNEASALAPIYPAWWDAAMGIN